MMQVIRHLTCLLGNALLQGMREWLVADVVHNVHQVHKKCFMHFLALLRPIKA